MKHSYPKVNQSVIYSLLLCGLLTGCVSYQPRLLVPSLTFSAEDLQLNEPAHSNSPGVDFGIETAVNESDSLFNVEVLPGIRVRSVIPGGPASLAGIQAGDVILSVNGTETNNPDTLVAIAQQSQEQSAFQFQIRRNTAVLAANLIPRPASANSAPLRELYRVDPIATRAGYRTELLTVQDQADITVATIVDIQPGSPLLTDGFAVDDMILAVNGNPIESAQGLINNLNTDFALGETVSVTVFSHDQLLEKSLTLWDPGRRISRLSLWPLLLYESTLSPQRTSLSILDFWLFSVYRFDRNVGERQHRLFELIRFSSDYGELIEETQ